MRRISNQISTIRDIIQIGRSWSHSPKVNQHVPNQQKGPLGVCVPTVGLPAPHFWDSDHFQFSIYHLLPPIFAILLNRSQKWEPVMYISLLVLQNKHDLTSFKGDCRYYILVAIILIPTYPVLGAIILKLAL